jgi:hypothetical protein
MNRIGGLLAIIFGSLFACSLVLTLGLVFGSTGIPAVQQAISPYVCAPDETLVSEAHECSDGEGGTATCPTFSCVSPQGSSFPAWKLYPMWCIACLIPALPLIPFIITASMAARGRRRQNGLIIGE